MLSRATLSVPVIWGFLIFGTLAAQAVQPPGQPPQSRPLNSIEVLVNDEPISTFDIQQRLRFVIAMSGGISSEDEFIRVREQVIRSMVDERLQLQEAAERGLDIPDAQLDEFFARRAQGLGQSPNQLEAALIGIGSSKDTMIRQMRAEFAWSQLVNGLLGRMADASAEEVQAEIDRLRANKGKFEWRLQEIVLLVSSPDQEDNVRQNAEAIVKQLENGASFGELAQQISESSSAAVGGDMGWATADKLPESLQKAIESKDVGDITEPIRTPGGYTILFTRDRRRIMTADPLDTQLDLRQLFLSKEDQTDEARVARFKENVLPLKEKGLSCDEVDSVSLVASASDDTTVGTIRLRQIEKSARQELASLDPGQTTGIMDMPDGLRVLIVCDKRLPEVREPDFDEILDQLTQQRLSMMARRFLRDLRRDAIVDYR